MYLMEIKFRFLNNELTFERYILLRDSALEVFTRFRDRLKELPQEEILKRIISIQSNSPKHTNPYEMES